MCVRTVSERDVQSRLQALSGIDGPQRSLRGAIDSKQASVTEDEIQARIQEESQRLLKQAERLLAQREAQLEARERALAAHEAGIDLSAINAETVARVGELESQISELEVREMRLQEALEAERARAGELEHLLGYGSYVAPAEDDSGLTDALKTELEALQGQIATREREVAQLQLAAKSADERRGELERVLADVRADAARKVDPDDMRQRMAQLEKQAKAAGDLERRAEELEAQLAAAGSADGADPRVAALEAELAALREAAGTTGDGQALALGEEVARLQAELAEARAAVLAAEGAAAAAAAGAGDKEQADGRIAILEEALFKLQLDIEQRPTPEALEELRARVGELEGELKEAWTSAGELTDEADRRSTEAEARAAAAEAAIEELRKAGVDAADVAVRLAAAEAELANAVATAEHQAAAVAEAVGRGETLGQEIAALRDELAARPDPAEVAALAAGARADTVGARRAPRTRRW